MNVGSEESLGGERFSDEGPASQERSPVNDGLEKLNPVVKYVLIWRIMLHNHEIMRRKHILLL